METISGSFITFLLNALWQIPLIAVVAALACRLMRNGPAAHRHFVWVAALAASLLLPVASVSTGQDSVELRAAIPAPPATPAQPASASAQPAATAIAQKSRTVSYAPATGGILAGAYLLFLLVCCGRLVWVWRLTERIREASAPLQTPPLVERVWLRCLATFGLYDVELLSSPSILSPVTSGAWRKTIILPQALLAETSEDVLATAIGHEMAHLARRDFAMRVVYELACLPISFHPAVLFIRRGIEQTREMACDELVTRKLLDAGIYARSIVTIAASMSGLSRPGYTLGVFDGDILEQRIRRLLERRAANLTRARLLLATGLGALALCAAIAGGLAISAHAQGGPALSEMKLGGDASNRGDDKAAVEHFQNAVRLDPSNIRPKLFLANALLREITPGNADSNLPAVRQQYLDVLALDPKNRQGMEGMVSVGIYAKQFSEAHDWVLKLLAQDAKNESAYYSAGFLDWSIAYPAYAKARAAAGMKPQDPGIIPDLTARQTLRNQFGPQLEDGFRMLQIALQLNPGDDAAMAYLNLLYRIKSGIVDSDAESRDLVAKADQWVDRALAAKREHAQNRQQGNAPLDVEGEPPGPGNPQAVLAPPPPPPPPPGVFGDLNQPASTLPLPPKNANEVAGLYWQVGGQMSAKDLVGVLQQKGFTVRIVTGTDRQTHVLVGPFKDSLSLDQGKTALSAAGMQVVREW